MYALEEFATARGLPYGERTSLLALATDIGRAEDRLRREGVLGQYETIPSLLACHWAEGVHIVRMALAANWLARPLGLEYLARAGELAGPLVPELVGGARRAGAARAAQRRRAGAAVAARGRPAAAARRGKSAADAAARRFRSGRREVNRGDVSGIPGQTLRYRVP